MYVSMQYGMQYIISRLPTLRTRREQLKVHARHVGAGPVREKRRAQGLCSPPSACGQAVPVEAGLVPVRSAFAPSSPPAWALTPGALLDLSCGCTRMLRRCSMAQLACCGCQPGMHRVFFSLLVLALMNQFRQHRNQGPLQLPHVRLTHLQSARYVMDGFTYRRTSAEQRWPHVNIHT